MCIKNSQYTLSSSREVALPFHPSNAAGREKKNALPCVLPKNERALDQQHKQRAALLARMQALRKQLAINERQMLLEETSLPAATRSASCIQARYCANSLRATSPSHLSTNAMRTLIQEANTRSYFMKMIHERNAS